jgi:aminopeptidase-like protein
MAEALTEGDVGRRLHDLVADLYPICRSITGDGVRATLRRLGELVPMRVHEVPTGTPVLDWTVPREWNVREAYLADARGERVVDLAHSTLHLMSYSVPVRGWFSMDELRPHLHTLPEHPDWIPYRTSYYREDWGFCLSERQRAGLTDDRYEVVIDASLEPGHLTYGEVVVPGETEDEVLVSCHVCHPSLANDNLSGIALATFLAAELAETPRRHTYRFVFVPGTIGSITWLARNEDLLPRIRYGLTLATLGDGGGFTYKRSRRGEARIDRVVASVLAHAGSPSEVVDFSPFGYDERQYCSPGFDLPVGALSRTPHGRYAEYHTSADDLDLVRPEALAGSLDVLRAIVRAVDADRTYVNLSPKGEPQLGRRGLYPSVGGPDIASEQLAMLWMLNQSDGTHGVLDVAERSGMSIDRLASVIDPLVRAGLLEER